MRAGAGLAAALATIGAVAAVSGAASARALKPSASMETAAALQGLPAPSHERYPAAYINRRLAGATALIRGNGGRLEVIFFRRDGVAHVWRRGRPKLRTARYGIVEGAAICFDTRPYEPAGNGKVSCRALALVERNILDRRRGDVFRLKHKSAIPPPAPWPLPAGRVASLADVAASRPAPAE